MEIIETSDRKDWFDVDLQTYMSGELQCSTQNVKFTSDWNGLDLIKGGASPIVVDMCPYLQQQNIKVYYENQVVGNYFADIISDQVILEIKSAKGLREENKAQLINYLKATDKEVGLLLNFGRTPEFKRVIFTNDRKE